MRKCLLLLILLAGMAGVLNAAPRVLLAGDSTVADYPESQLPLCGWGQALKKFALPDTEVYNFALSGASTRTFRASGQWDNLLNAITDGTVVFIQFGHNDAAADEAKHVGFEQEYPANLTRFIEEVRARKGIPILCTPVAYRLFNPNGTLQNLHGEYPGVVRKVAQDNDVPLLDLTAISTELYVRYGAEASKLLFNYREPGEYPNMPEGAADDCHSNPRGAEEVARAVVRELHRRDLPGAEGFRTPAWEFDFTAAPAGNLPAPWAVWFKDGKGEAAIAAAPGGNGNALKVTGAEAAGLQYDLPVQPGETYLIQAEMQQDGKGNAALVAAWKGTNRSWLPLPQIPGTFRITGTPVKKAMVKVTVPEGVEYLCVMLGVENQWAPEDAAYFYRVDIRQLAEKPVVPPPNEAAPHLNLSITPADYSPVRSNEDVLKTLRMANIKHSNVIGHESFPWITPETAPAMAKKIREAGYNCVLTEGQRFIMRDAATHTGTLDVIAESLIFPELVENTRAIVEAFRAEGLKVYLHLTAGLAPEEFYRDRPEWMIKSVLDNGKRTYWGLNWICQNNAEYGKAYRSHLEQLIDAVRPDGLMIDETSNMYDACGCPDCRARFTADTGLVMPAAGDTAWFRDLSNPVYRRFLEWRIACVKQENDDFRAILQKYVPDGALLSYYAVPYNEQAWYDHGISLETGADVGEIFGLETISNYKKYWAMFIGSMKLTRYVAELQHGTGFTITAFPDYDVLYYSWLLNLSLGGHQYWTWYQGDAMKEQRKPLIQWEMLHEQLFAGLESAGEVAVIFSSRDLNLRRQPRGRIQRQNLYFALANNLTLAQVPYRAYGDRNLEQPVPESVKVIVAMDTGILTDRAAANLRDFVAGGGKLIASSDFALFDADGEARGNFALADVIGCDWTASPEGEATLTVKGEAVSPMDALTTVKPRTGAEVIGTLTPGGEPGLIRNRFGKGEAWYFAGSIAPAIYWNEFNGTAIVDRDYGDARQERAAELLLRVVNGDTPYLTTENLPPGVVVEKFSQEGVPQLHILNYSGMVTEGRPETEYFHFPVITGGRVTIPALPCKTILAYSPEFPEAVEVLFERQDDKLTISLPEFRHLLILRFE